MFNEERQYGDELIIYAMALMEEQELNPPGEGYDEEEGNEE